MARVLVVEDDASIRKLLRVTFELGGYEVLLADCGEAALEMAHAELPDVVVCDLMMPVMNGLTVLQELRGSERTRQIPFVFVTGSSAGRDAAKAIEMGAEKFVIKPFDPQYLVDTVDAVLNP